MVPGGFLFIFGGSRRLDGEDTTMKNTTLSTAQTQLLRAVDMEALRPRELSFLGDVREDFGLLRARGLVLINREGFIMLTPDGEKVLDAEGC